MSLELDPGRLLGNSSEPQDPHTEALIRPKMAREVRGFYSVIDLRNRGSRMDDFRANLVDESTATSDRLYRVYLRLNLDELVEGSYDLKRNSIRVKDRSHLSQRQGRMIARQDEKDSCRFIHIESGSEQVYTQPAGSSTFLVGEGLDETLQGYTKQNQDSSSQKPSRQRKESLG